MEKRVIKKEIKKFITSTSGLQNNTTEERCYTCDGKLISEETRFLTSKREYNEKGLETSYSDSLGFSSKKKYDEKGNQIHYKNSSGNECFMAYDKDGRLISTINNSGYGYKELIEYTDEGKTVTTITGTIITIEKYDKNNNEIYYKNDFECKEYKKEYNEDGILTSYIDLTNGYTKNIEIDNKNNKRIYTSNHGEKIVEKYDKNGNITHSRDFNTGLETFYVYDSKGNLIRKYNNRGYELLQFFSPTNKLLYKSSISEDINEYKEYDENDRLIYHRSTKLERWLTYDERGNRITYKNSKGYWSNTKYDQNDNIIFYEDSEGMKYVVIYEYYDDLPVEKRFKCPICNKGHLGFKNKDSRLTICDNHKCQKSFIFNDVYHDSESIGIRISYNIINPEDNGVTKVEYRVPCLCDSNNDDNSSCNGMILYCDETDIKQGYIIKKRHDLFCNNCTSHFKKIDIDINNLTYLLYRKGKC